MLYGKLTSPTTVELPLIEEKDVRRLLSNVTLPRVLTNEVLNPHGFVCVPAVYSDLRQTFDKKYAFDVVFNEETNEFERTVYLETLPEDVALERRKNKWEDLLEKVKKGLAETEHTQADDYFELRTQWDEYRRQLKAIAAMAKKDEVDPFTIEMPQKPSYIEETIEGLKDKKKDEIKQAYLAEVNARPRVETSLGFAVDGSRSDLENFKDGKELGLLEVRDADNNTQAINETHWDIIISAVRQNGLAILQKKWALQDQIDGVTTTDLAQAQTELDAISW
jgi:hypothetical protein